MSALAAAQDAVALARTSLDAAEAREAMARQAFLDAPATAEAEAAHAIDEATQAVQVERLRVQKREAALIEAEELERAEAERRRCVRVAELRSARLAFLAELRESLPRVLAARRAFAAAVSDVVAVVARENDRAAELRALGQVEPSTDIDVVRLAIGQLIEREAPAERAELDQLPTRVIQLVDSLTQSEVGFEVGLRQLRNEFVAAAGPTLADFCAPQPLLLSGAALATDLNAKDAAALLREIEENQS